MSFNNAGVFNRLYNWVTDAANGINIQADRMDAEMNGFADGLSLCLTRDSRAAMIADLKMGGFKIVNVKDPVDDQDAATKKFVETTVADVVGIAFSDTPPENPEAGDTWFKTSAPTGLFIWVVGPTSSAWVSAAGQSFVPSGAIMMWSGAINAIPTGWVLCDGQNSTPDLRDRFIVGAGTTYNVNDIGGAKEVVLTEAQMPSHTHDKGDLAIAQAGAHKHTFTRRNTNAFVPVSGSVTVGFVGTNGEPVPVLDTSTAGDHTHTISGNVGSKGGGAAHENRPPYFALAYIMKT